MTTVPPFGTFADVREAGDVIDERRSARVRIESLRTNAAVRAYAPGIAATATVLMVFFAFRWFG